MKSILIFLLVGIFWKGKRIQSFEVWVRPYQTSSKTTFKFITLMYPQMLFDPSKFDRFGYELR